MEFTLNIKVKLDSSEWTSVYNTVNIITEIYNKMEEDRYLVFDGENYNKDEVFKVAQFLQGMFREDGDSVTIISHS